MHVFFIGEANIQGDSTFVPESLRVDMKKFHQIDLLLAICQISDEIRGFSLIIFSIYLLKYGLQTNMSLKFWLYFFTRKLSRK